MQLWAKLQSTCTCPVLRSKNTHKDIHLHLWILFRNQYTQKCPVIYNRVAGFVDQLTLHIYDLFIYNRHSVICNTITGLIWKLYQRKTILIELHSHTYINTFVPAASWPRISKKCNSYSVLNVLSFLRMLDIPWPLHFMTVHHNMASLTYCETVYIAKIMVFYIWCIGCSFDLRPAGPEF